MKNLKFYIIILLLAALCTWLLVRSMRQSDRIAQIEQRDKQVAKAIQTQAKQLSREVDEKGIETVIFDVTKNVATPEQVKSSKSIKGIIDTTAMALDIRTKQLKQVLVVNSSLAAENLKLKRALDANQRPVYTYQGNGLNLRFTPANEADSTSVATADFTADLRIKATQYWKRKWFLGAKKSILAVSSDNPLFKINGADFVEFEQQQPTFGLRIQAGANYNPQTGSIGFGPAARFDFGRFSVQGNYTWYPESERWRPSVNGTYDLLRF